MNAHLARAHVLSEEETRTGWVYRVALKRGDDAREHHVRLAWVDHDHWSGGRAQPSHVVERLMELLAELEIEIPERFDASTARRWHTDLDARLIARL